VFYTKDGSSVLIVTYVGEGGDIMNNKGRSLIIPGGNGRVARINHVIGFYQSLEGKR
jgi:hypothetical protein